MVDRVQDDHQLDLQLSERQSAVLRAVVTGYVGEAAPVGSASISYLLPVSLSSASIRNTMAELSELGLIEQPHKSAGRVPTAQGLRQFVDHLMGPAELAPYDRRSLDHSFGEVEARAAVHLTSELLSHHTGQLGFVTSPRLERVELRHVSLVRLSSEKLLVVLVSKTGQPHQRVISDPGSGDQAELDRVAALLNERVVGRTLPQLRAVLVQEMHDLRAEANTLIRRALALGLLAVEATGDDPADLVIVTRLALLGQPEFHDPERLRELFEVIEARGFLVELLDQLLRGDVSVAFGEELDDPGLRRCAVVLAPYGGDVPPLGAVGVIGPSRMNYGRVIPLVGYCSQLITAKITENPSA
ncbi:MAG: heat-inducible transcriptional repressor HrcA [Proteobacteria bacterium]|nr:heat-inducible transcriptional repressor HrcA [Pseudomonadota bacterium]